MDLEIKGIFNSQTTLQQSNLSIHVDLKSGDLESSPDAANYQPCDLSRHNRAGAGRTLTFTKHLLCARNTSYLKKTEKDYLPQSLF